jgi:hypothetical protein
VSAAAERRQAAGIFVYLQWNQAAGNAAMGDDAPARVAAGQG